MRHVAGGTAANVAANLAYFGWQSSLLARIGNDSPARRVKFDLANAGVPLAADCFHPEVETPVVIHEVKSHGHSFRFTCPNCEQQSSKFRPLELEHLNGMSEDGRPPDSFDVVFVDRVSSSSLAMLERAPHSLRVLEPSAKGFKGLALESAELAHVFKWSHELRSDLHSQMLRPRESQLQIETLGAAGLRVRYGSEPWRRQSAPKVKSVDTAGAGDWLTAAFLNALPSLDLGSLDSAEIDDALAAGQGVAALSCLFVGARALSSLPLSQARSAAGQLREERLDSVPSVPKNGRRSEPVEGCPICLRPVSR